MRRGLLVSAGVLTGAIILALPPAASPHYPITTTILFKKEIAQIFQRKCFQCHSDNNLAMSLTTYERARPWARAIQEEVLERRMPPWGAVPGFGHFANDNSLTPRETAIIVAWTQGGAPSGVPKMEESIPPVFVPRESAWDQAPDAALPVAPQTIEANAPLRTTRVEVPTGLTQTRWLRAIAFKPGDRRVVHSVSFYESASGAWLGAWTPWQTTFRWPPGAGVSLPAKGKLVVEIVYDGIEETVTDRGEVGLYFAAAPPAAKIAMTTITTPPSS